jgi:hypothetical protein
MSPEIEATAALVLLGGVGLAAVLYAYRPSARRAEEVQAAAAETVRTLEIPVLALPVDVPAGPNYTSGEWPVVGPARHAAEDDDRAEPIEVDPEPEPVADEPPAAPWWTLPTATAAPRLAVDQEPTPLFRPGVPVVRRRPAVRDELVEPG